MTTYTGSGTAASTDSTGTAATHKTPVALTVDTTNTNMYCSDYSSHVLRLIVLSSAAVTTFAGTAGSKAATDATGAAARFRYPRGSLFATTTPLYICDENNHMRAVTTPGAVVDTWAGTSSGFADGTGTTGVQFNQPHDLAFDATNPAMFIADNNNDRIRKATVPGAVVTSPLGSGTRAVLDGVGTSAQFQNVESITIDSSSTVLFVGERTAHKVRRIVIASLTVTTVIGSGTVGMTSSSDPLTALVLALISTKYTHTAPRFSPTTSSRHTRLPTAQEAGGLRVQQQQRRRALHHTAARREQGVWKDMD